MVNIHRFSLFCAKIVAAFLDGISGGSNHYNSKKLNIPNMARPGRRYGGRDAGARGHDRAPREACVRDAESERLGKKTERMRWDAERDSNGSHMQKLLGVDFERDYFTYLASLIESLATCLVLGLKWVGMGWI